jgi:23S rRNA (cytidine2498-2'-O)-methyltransferase
VNPTWIAFTRPGFEADFSKELREGEPFFASGSGWVRFEVSKDHLREKKPWRELPLNRLIFARQLFLAFVQLKDVDPESLAAKVSAATAQWLGKNHGARGIHSLFVETPDTEAGRILSAEMGALGESIVESLNERRLLAAGKRGAVRLHVFLAARGETWVGVSDPRLSSPWPSGIPRLQIPAEVPGRSARKLEEAILLFLPDTEERLARMRGGMRAVDLGASPGGWSWVLAERGLLVEAVDNGIIAPMVLETGLVTPVQADGFLYRPDRTRIHWLVCDIPASAPRVARLVTTWVQRGYLGEAIFNIRLGRTNRMGEIERVAQSIREGARSSGYRIELHMKHLYHDRDEVTAHLTVIERIEVPPEEAEKPPRKSARAPGKTSAGISGKAPAPKGEKPAKGRTRGRPGAESDKPARTPRRGAGRSK